MLESKFSIYYSVKSRLSNWEWALLVLSLIGCEATDLASFREYSISKILIRWGSMGTLLKPEWSDYLGALLAGWSPVPLHLFLALYS